MGRAFIWIIIHTYVTISINFDIFRAVKWWRLETFNVSALKTKDTWLNKFLILMLIKHKRISGTKTERIYFYYSKKICKLMMLLAVPWFILVYFMGWYENNIFLKWHFFLSLIICLLPTLILDFMMVIYDIKVALYNRRSKK